jgi:hypothetical protein
LEKISAIFEYSVSDTAYLFSPLSGVFATSTAQYPDYNIHYFIGAEMFGLANLGVPPSILGEIILYLGPIFVFPVTFIIALFLARMERLLVQTPSIFLKLFLLLLLANSYFLLLNSDMLSLIKRTIFDSAFLFIAIFVVYSVKSGGNQSAHRENQAG